MNIEKERCVRSLKKLGMEHPEEFLGDYGQKGPFLALEEGKLTPAGFREALREYLPAGVTDEQIDDAFNDSLGNTAFSCCPTRIKLCGTRRSPKSSARMVMTGNIISTGA